MDKPKLLIKYQGQYLCEYEHYEYRLIHVPTYFETESFSNISIFIMLLLTGVIDEDYFGLVPLNYEEALERSEMSFFPDYLRQIDENTFYYDVDALTNDETKSDVKEYIEKSLEKRPKRIILNTLKGINETKKEIERQIEIEESKYAWERPYLEKQHYPIVNSDLEFAVRCVEKKRGEKDVLLLYSGGKDSTLAALRLVKRGYQVYFLHFDNGAMLDTDKPFLTWKKSFAHLDGYHFPFDYAKINIEKNFNLFFRIWKELYGDRLENGSIDSEIRCLACRSAMYVGAIKIARKEGFHYIADGARISQGFMIEQIPMIERYQALAKKYHIEVLYPVLDLVSDQEEIEELLKNGFSAKTWESKCLLGRTAMHKTQEDQTRILKYYDERIKPNC